MSKQTITVTIKEESSDSQETDSTYIPSQTPSSEEYSSVESSSFEGGSDTDYSIACSEDCSGSSDLSSYYTDSEYSQ